MSEDRSIDAFEAEAAAGLRRLGEADERVVDDVRSSIASLPDRRRRHLVLDLMNARRLVRVVAAVAAVAIVVAAIRVFMVMPPGIAATPVTTYPMIPPTELPSSPPITAGSLSPGTSPTPHYVEGTASLNGTAAWVMTGSGLSVSSDGGRTWSAPALPPATTAQNLLQVEGAPGRGFWLAFREGNAIRFYRTPDGATWSSTLLAPTWPQIFQVSGPPELVLIAPGPGGLLTVAETVGVGTANAVTALFISTDEGVTFVQRPPTSGSVANEYWHWMAFLDADRGVVGIGPETGPGSARSAVAVIHTSDGGRTWSRSSFPSAPVPATGEIGAPALVGSDIVTPITSWASDGSDNGSFRLAISHDAGASFTSLGNPLPKTTGLLPITATATLGGVSWVVAQGDQGPPAIYKTADAAATWASVPAPGSIVDLTLTGPTSAIAVIDSKTCDSAQGCHARTYLVTTSDGGSTWSVV